MQARAIILNNKCKKEEWLKDDVNERVWLGEWRVKKVALHKGASMLGFSIREIRRRWFKTSADKVFWEDERLDHICSSSQANRLLGFMAG